MDDMNDQEKWYDSYEFRRFLLLVLMLIGALAMLIVMWDAIDDARKAQRVLEMNREAAISQYFLSNNIMIMDSSFGSNRYEVLTENGKFVVELNEDSSKVVKALPISVMEVTK